ncbi:MAG: PrsW family intramembrane metalloprotease [Mycobacterium sp.]|nr:PrsW family intramembrane metalloprotease [Mycobacterium sp.]
MVWPGSAHHSPDAGGVRTGVRDVGGIAHHQRERALQRHCQSWRCSAGRRRRDVRSGGGLGYHLRSPRRPRPVVRRVSVDRDRRGRRREIHGPHRTIPRRRRPAARPDRDDLRSSQSRSRRPRDRCAHHDRHQPGQAGCDSAGHRTAHLRNHYRVRIRDSRSRSRGDRTVRHRLGANGNDLADDPQHQPNRRGEAVTTTTLADLDRARDIALDLSGWGRRFSFYQPRNFAFWGYLLLVGLGFLVYISKLAREYDAYGEAIGLAVTSFAIYAALFWWFAAYIDHYAKLPAKLMVVAFLWGGFAATGAMAANANDAILALYGKTFGQVWALNWGAGLAAPFTEEWAKGSGLLLLIAMAPRQIRTAFDGFIMGAFIGLGFQIIEDISYAMTSAGTQFGANQIEASVGTIILRMASGVAAHVLYSSIFCAGLVYLLGRPGEPRRVGRGLLLIAIPMLLHGTWDSLGAIAGPSALKLIGLLIATIVIALVIVVRVYKLTVKPEQGFVRDVMAPEQARNVITAAELDAMAGNRKARKAYRKASRTGQERKRARYVLNAAYALADELATARGADTDPVRFARAEVARIRAGVPSPW